MTSASGFTVLIAMDLRGGRVVRLTQGDFDRETTFSEEPESSASMLLDAGARWLHVVDLDGARAGRPIHAETIAAIGRSVHGVAALEVAGGLRTDETVGRMLAHGAKRVVVGTAAIRDQGFAARLVERWGPSAIAVAVDVQGGRAHADGWSSTAGDLDPAALIARLADVGVTTFEVTAIDRDGTLNGPDLGLYRTLVDAGRGDIVASGGISSVADLAAVRDAGCVGAIVGRAIYEGRLSVADAVSVGQRQPDGV